MLKLGISTYIPRKARGVAASDGFFTKDDFVYDSQHDAYICPNKCKLFYKFFVKGSGAKRYKSKTSDCNNCPLRDKCLRGKQKYKSLYEQSENAGHSSNQRTMPFICLRDKY
jgi:hypothetical protein